MNAVLQLKVASAALMLVCAAMLLASRMPARARIGFGAFFLLVSVNSAVEALRSSLGLSEGPYDPLRGVAIVLAAFDPFVLVYALSVYPRQNALYRLRVLLPLLAAASALALTAPLAAGPWRVQHELAMAAHTALAYGIAAGYAARQLLRADGRAPGILFPALAVAAIPAISRTLVRLSTVVSGSDVAVGQVVVVGTVGVIAASVVAGAWLLLAGRTPRALGAGLVLAGVVDLPLHASYGVRQAVSLLGVDPAGAAAVDALKSAAGEARWIAITFLLVAAAYRSDALAMAPRRRQQWAQAVIVIAALLFALPLLLSLQARLFGVPASALGPIELALVVAAVAFMPPTQRAASYLARKLFGAPGSDAGSAERFYSSAIEASYASGRAEDVAYLQGLRQELGISEMRNAAIMMNVRRERSHALAPGTVVGGRYRIDALLRRGGAGRTFRASDLVLSREVVVKEVPLEDGSDGSVVLREARTLGSVSHPHVVQIHDALFTPESVLLVMEFIERGSLQEHLRAHGSLSAEEGIPLLVGILSGLEAVHAAGIVHRDVKPANILLASDATPKLADFGLARWTDAPTIQTQGIVHGTPGYIAPEVLAGEGPTAASDLFAVARIALQHVELPRTPAFDAWVGRGLAADPAARFASASEMLHGLREAVAARESAPVPREPQGGVETPQTW